MTVQSARGKIEIDAEVKGKRDAEDLGKGLGTLERHLGKTGAAMLKADLAARVLSAAYVALKRSIGDALRTSLDWEDHVGGNIEAVTKMSAAIDGMISKLDLARAASVFGGEGFQFQQKTLNAAAKAAVVFARINKRDFAPSLDAIVNAITGGREKVFREMGHDIEFTGNKVQKTAQMVKFLEENFGDMTIKASNANERLAQMDTALSDVIGQLGSAILKTEGFTAATGMLVEALQGAKQLLTETKFAELRGELHELRLELGLVTTQAPPKAATDLWGTFFSVIEFGSRRSAAELRDLITLQQAGIEAARRFKFVKVKDEDPDTDKLRRALGIGKPRKRDVRDKPRRRGGITRAERARLGATAELEPAVFGEAEAGFERGEEAKASLAVIDAKIKEAEVVAGADAAWARYLQTQDRAFQKTVALANQQREFNDLMTSLGTGVLTDVAGGMLDIAAAAAAGEKNIGAMALALLKGITLGLAKQLLALGITYEIKGAAALATGVESGLAPGYFAAAKLSFGGAATVGALGIGISAAGGASAGGSAGGGGRSGARPQGPSATGPGFRPSGTARGDGSLSQVFEVHVNAHDAMDAMLLGKAIRRHARTDD